MLYYYLFASIVFDGDTIKSAQNVVYQSKTPCTIIDFRKQVEMNFAGDPDTYDQIIITCWQELDKTAFDNLNAEMQKNNELRAEKLERKQAKTIQ